MQVKRQVLRRRISHVQLAFALFAMRAILGSVGELGNASCAWLEAGMPLACADRSYEIKDSFHE